MSIKRNYIEVNGSRWAYLKFGKGKPLMLLHGIMFYGDFLYPLSNELFENFEIIIPDLPGFGFTEGIKEGNTYQNITEQLVTFTQALGYKKMSYFGCSLGATILLDLVIKYPDLVDTLVLNSPVWRKSGIKKGKIEKILFSLAALPPKTLKLLQDRKLLKTLINGVLMIKPEILDVVNNYEDIIIESLKIMDTEAAIELFHSLQEVELIKELKRIRKHIIIIAGEKDTVITLDENIALGRILKSVEVLTVREGTHDLIIQNPKILAQGLKFIFQEIDKPKEISFFDPNLIYVPEKSFKKTRKTPH